MIKLAKHREEMLRLSSATPVKEALGLPDGMIEDTKLFIRQVLEEKQAGKRVPRVILNVFCKEDFLNYLNKVKKFSC